MTREESYELDKAVCEAMGWTHVEMRDYKFVGNDPNGRFSFAPEYSQDPEMLAEMLEWAAAQGHFPQIACVPDGPGWRATLWRDAFDNWVVREGSSPNRAVALAIAALGQGEWEQGQ